MQKLVGDELPQGPRVQSFLGEPKNSLHLAPSRPGEKLKHEDAHIDRDQNPRGGIRQRRSMVHAASLRAVSPLVHVTVSPLVRVTVSLLVHVMVFPVRP